LVVGQGVASSLAVLTPAWTLNILVPTARLVWELTSESDKKSTVTKYVNPTFRTKRNKTRPTEKLSNKNSS
jgi:hypothetical protein